MKMRRMLMFLHAWHNQHFFFVVEPQRTKNANFITFYFSGLDTT